MGKDEDEAPRLPPTAHVIGQVLDELSVAELGERIAMLRAEIERLEGARQAKEASRASAATFFKSASQGLTRAETKPRGSSMPSLTLAELDERIADVRENLRELSEQAAAFSGAEDETRAADRIKEQEQLLASLLKERQLLAARLP
jgi:uncharacterized small protein (DUF1192 family)